MEAIEAAYPGIPRDHVHVWTLGGPSREHRIGKLWAEWRELGAHWWRTAGRCREPGFEAFTESGTYAPVFRVGPFNDEDGEPHVFICDGYAATAEAMQGASLDPILGLKTSMCLFSSKFMVSYERGQHVMRLDPDADDFAARLADTLDEEIDHRSRSTSTARSSTTPPKPCMPLDKRTITADDFFPKKEWRVLALAGYMLPDPYTGAPGLEQIADDR